MVQPLGLVAHGFDSRLCREFFLGEELYYGIYGLTLNVICNLHLRCVIFIMYNALDCLSAVPLTSC